MTKHVVHGATLSGGIISDIYRDRSGVIKISVTLPFPTLKDEAALTKLLKANKTFRFSLEEEERDD